MIRIGHLRFYIKDLAKAEALIVHSLIYLSSIFLCFFLTDNEDPIFVCPIDMSPVDTISGEKYAKPEYEYSVIDNSGLVPTTIVSQESGDQQEIGESTVTITATDGSGNSAECSFVITVVGEQVKMIFSELCVPDFIVMYMDIVDGYWI